MARQAGRGTNGRPPGPGTDPCRDCPRRDSCAEPCEALERLLDRPDGGRLARNISPRAAQEVDLLLEHARLLPARAEAMVHLYYRCGFTMQRIAEAFRLNRSTVCRAIAATWRRAARRCNSGALSDRPSARLRPAEPDEAAFEDQGDAGRSDSRD